MQVTTKQLMDRSKLFRLLFWGSIVCVVVGIILSIVYPFTSCYTTSKRSCTWNFGSAYPFECQSYNVVFCCGYGFSSCGNNSYCRIKPSYNFHCDGVIIAAWSLLGTGLFLAIFVFVLFCKYRQQVREGKYLSMPRPIRSSTKITQVQCSCTPTLPINKPKRPWPSTTSISAKTNDSSSFL